MTEDAIRILTDALKKHPDISAVGLAGKSAGIAEGPLNDVDLFVYCSAIPQSTARKELVAGLEGVADYTPDPIEKGVWGEADRFIYHGAETWLMYFTVEEARREAEDILRGRVYKKISNYFYPTGRIAMYRSMKALYDRDGFIAELQAHAAVYPEELAQRQISYHVSELRDTEDLERAVELGDVLFYHFALDIALDHLLQALFAINRVYFPSRKRSAQHIAKFALRPENCEKQLEQIVAEGSTAGSLKNSLAAFKKLAGWIESNAGGQ